MKKTTVMIIASCAGLWLASCAEPASEDEINQMCTHLGDISGKAGPPGAAADLAILDQSEGEQQFSDTYGHTISGRLRLQAWKTIRNGAVLAPIVREAERYDFVLK